MKMPQLTKEEWMHPVHMEMPVINALAIVGSIQLSLRHAGNNGQAAEMAKDFATGLHNTLVEKFPQLREILDLGWNPDYDAVILEL